MIHSFLLIGQSNAAGRGYFSDVEPLDNLGGRLKVMRNGLWLGMFRPVNPDRATSGVCLAETFAAEYARAHEDVEVGIIPCADGGTSLVRWMPGEILFDNAVNCAKLAMRKTELKGILWHQGESDCSDERCGTYEARFVTMMNALRKELGLPDIPVIVGGLGDFLVDFEEGSDVSRNYKKLNEALCNIGASYHNCAYASAEGLGANPDNLHFCAAALREFGVRYYKAFEKFDSKEAALDSTKGDTERSAIELL